MIDTTNEQGADSAIVAIRENYKQESTVSVDHHNELDEDKTDSAIKAIGTNETKNSRQRHGDHRYELQEWIFKLEADELIDRVNVTIDRQ
jgi:uncharacterized membrane-anchored protein